jgi:anti-anti-sigma regulatory factor
MSRSIVRRSYRGSAVRSRKSRTVQEMTALETVGGGILIVELQGALFFGTAETLASEIVVQMQQRTHQVILDLRRVTEIDSTGAELLRRIDADLSARGASFAICVLQPSEPAAVLADAGVLDGITPERVFGHVDGALEWAEEQMLGAQVGNPAAKQDTPLARAGIFAGLTPKEMATVERYLRRTEIDKGRTIFAQGESGSDLFIITSGTASAYLHQDRGADIRLTTFAPGTVFGELAILDPGPRSATVIADEALVCFALSDEDFVLLSGDAPKIAIKILANLSRALSRRLRQANRTIHQLEE